MGSDKAALQTDGETQLKRTVRLLNRHVDCVFVSTQADQSDDPVLSGFDQIVDAYDDLGPVAGILSAMDSDPEKSWLVLACDLPNIDDEPIEFLVANADADCLAPAYVSVVDGLPEPLCAIWRPGSRAIIEQYGADGYQCPRKMLINSPTRLLEQPAPGALHNVNTPGDLAGTGVEFMT